MLTFTYFIFYHHPSLSEILLMRQWFNVIKLQDIYVVMCVLVPAFYQPAAALDIMADIVPGWFQLVAWSHFGARVALMVDIIAAIPE